jgi:HNH endonuclease
MLRACLILIISCWGHHLPRNVSKPGKIHLQIVEVLKRFPEGATGGTIRQELEKEGLRPEDQTHLDRRKRDLKKWFVIKKIKGFQEVEGKKRTVILYKYAGERARVLDEGQVSLKVRAEVIHAAHGRCQACGETIERHSITLVVDHKIPRDWGCTNDRENLWAVQTTEKRNARPNASLNIPPEQLVKSSWPTSAQIFPGAI